MLERKSSPRSASQFLHTGRILGGCNTCYALSSISRCLGVSSFSVLRGGAVVELPNAFIQHQLNEK